jgi:hypothetical protein
MKTIWDLRKARCEASYSNASAERGSLVTMDMADCKCEWKFYSAIVCTTKKNFHDYYIANGPANTSRYLLSLPPDFTLFFFVWHIVRS